MTRLRALCALPARATAARSNLIATAIYGQARALVSWLLLSRLGSTISLAFMHHFRRWLPAVKRACFTDQSLKLAASTLSVLRSCPAISVWIDDCFLFILALAGNTVLRIAREPKVARIPRVVVVFLAAHHSETTQRLQNIAVFRSTFVSTDAYVPLRTCAPGFVWIHRDFQRRNYDDFSISPTARRYGIWHIKFAAKPSMTMGDAFMSRRTRPHRHPDE